jgi:hypothetical protein
MAEKAKKTESIKPVPEIDDTAPTAADGQPASTPMADSLDPFSPENLLLPQAFDEAMPVKKLLTMIPVRRPGNQEWIRVHPDPAFRQNLPIIELRTEREVYVVSKHLVPHLFGEIVYVTLYTAITRQGVLFLWPVRLPGPDGKDIGWWQSARDAAARGTREWIRVRANMGLGGYDVWTVPEDSLAQLDDPEWPGENFWDLVRIAFKTSLVDSLDHPVVQRLRGLS